MTKVIKRDGRIRDFDFNKIENAVKKVYASKTVNSSIPVNFISQLKEIIETFIDKEIKKNPDYAIPIEVIQDIIRDHFIKRNQKKAVEAFIIYREKRNKAREQGSWLTKEITKKIKGTDIQNQNANVDEESFGGKSGEITRTVLSDYALKYIVSKNTRDNHNNNIVYTHDRDNYAVGSHNCLSEPFDKMLANGVNTRQTDVRKANSLSTACQLVAVYFQVQSLNQFGGVSSTHLDWTLVPFFRKSFEKHYVIEYLKTLPEFYEIDFEDISEEDLDVWINKKVVNFFVETDLMDKSFELSNKKIFNDKWYQSALFETRRELYQSIEGLYHNLNTLQSRSGNQLPFTSLNYGTCTLLEGRMIIKSLLETSLKGLGKFHKTPIFPCGIFQIMKGVNDKPGTPNYDLKRLAIKSTSKRLYPNYANCNWSNQTKWVNKDREDKIKYINSLSEEEKNVLKLRLNDNEELCNKLDLNSDLTIRMTQHPYEIFSTMGCRTANGFDVNFLPCYMENVQSVINDKPLKFPTYLSAAQKDGRGNVCPATLILPTIAMMAVEEVCNTNDSLSLKDIQGSDELKTKFFKLLHNKINECKDSLLERFKWICSQSPNSAKFMYENGTMEGYIPSEGIISAMKHGTLAIGQLGLAETLQILVGCDHTEEKGMNLAIEIESLFEEKCNQFKAEYSLNFGVYYTPAENLCYTAFKKWKEKYGELENVTYFYKTNENGDKIKEDKLYFTNSIHVPVWHKISSFEKIDIESKLTGKSSAGCITYVEMPNKVSDNLDALEEVVDYAMEHDIPYFAVNVTDNTCLSCGYQGNIEDICPKCGSNHIERLGRVTGYLTGHYPDAFNKGKVSEFEDRVIHKKEIKF